MRSATRAGSNALSAPNGRWIVFAQTDDPADWQPRQLNTAYDFSRYGASYGAWSGDAGNGYAFPTARTASFSASLDAKVYDGSPVATVSSASVTPASGDTANLRPNPTATYADANAQNNKPATLDSNGGRFQPTAWAGRSTATPSWARPWATSPRGRFWAVSSSSPAHTMARPLPPSP